MPGAHGWAFHDPREQIIFVPNRLALEQLDAIQLPILQLRCGLGKRTRQPPSKKHDGMPGNPMWKSSLWIMIVSRPAARPPRYIPRPCLISKQPLRLRHQILHLRQDLVFQQRVVPHPRIQRRHAAHRSV